MILTANGPGIGDALVLSPVIRAVRSQRPDEPIMLTVGHAELYATMSGIDELRRWDAGRHANERTFPELDHMAALDRHQIVFMCEKVGVQPPAVNRIRCYYDFGADERPRLRGLPEELYVTLHAQPGAWTPNRDWAHDRWAALTQRLLGRGLKVIQVGGVHDPQLPTPYRLLGMALRQVARVMRDAIAHVGCVSGMMHLASGVGTRSVILYGREDPARTGYPGDRHVRSAIDCSPCWKVERCGRGAEYDGRWLPSCMGSLSVEAVEQAVVETVWGN